MSMELVILRSLGAEQGLLCVGGVAGEEVNKPQKRGWDAGFRAGRRSVWGQKSGTEGWKEQGAPFGN